MRTHPYALQLVLVVLRRLVFLAAVTIALIGIICVLVLVQGRRDETRSSGAAIVLATHEQSLEARLNHAFSLYRRGYINRIILTDAASDEQADVIAAAQEYLRGRGLPEQALLPGSPTTSTWESLNEAADIARSNGINSVLLVGDAPEMLRALKMSADLGIDAHPSPIPGSQNTLTFASAGVVLSEAWAYLSYVLVRV